MTLLNELGRLGWTCPHGYGWSPAHAHRFCMCWGAPCEPAADGKDADTFKLIGNYTRRCPYDCKGCPECER